MSIPLIDALRMADLPPGVYRERLDGRDVEVRVSDHDTPTPEFREQVMQLPPGELPRSPIGTGLAWPGRTLPPDPPVIPDDTEVTE